MLHRVLNVFLIKSTYMEKFHTLLKLTAFKSDVAIKLFKNSSNQLKFHYRPHLLHTHIIEKHTKQKV